MTNVGVSINLSGVDASFFGNGDDSAKINVVAHKKLDDIHFF
jgi:hypothetical protein